jgi:hypothetical protein
MNSANNQTSPRFSIVLSAVAISEHAVQSQHSIGSHVRIVLPRYMKLSNSIRICHAFSAKDEASAADQDSAIKRLSILWRSLVLSALGKTIYPYCRHLRSLPLGNLDALLQSRSEALAMFFIGELERFRITTSKRATRGSNLDIAKTIDAIGDILTRHAPMLEELSDPMGTSVISNPAVLEAWGPQLGHLRSLELFDGAVLAQPAVQQILHVHCPQLRSLRIYRCSNHDSDTTLAAFVNGLAQNMLVEFQNFNECHIGEETCQALNSHGKTLSTLRLMLSGDNVLALARLQDCTALETLMLEYSGPMQDLKSAQNDTYVKIVSWLQGCARLANITFQDFKSAPDLLTPVLAKQSTLLETLEVSARREPGMYVAKDNREFHHALSQQSMLRELVLTADVDLMSEDVDHDVIRAICALSNLRQLRLSRISDNFTDVEIQSLASSLPLLELLVVGGFRITDAIWPVLAQLRQLKHLAITGVTCFTADGIWSFVNSLGEGNRNMVLSMLYVDPDYSIEHAVLDSIRDTVASKLDGRFEYTLLRGEDELVARDLQIVQLTMARSECARI